MYFATYVQTRDFFAQWKKYWQIWLVSLLVSWAYAFSDEAIAEQIMKRIVVEGAERLTNETVLAYMDIKLPAPYNQVMLDNALRRLFATGFFQDAKISARGDTLVVIVTENPTVYRIAFEGNKKIRDQELQKELLLRPQSIYSLAKVQQDVKKITALYHRQGRYSVRVEPKIVKLSQNRIDVVYSISEGVKAKIHQINFTGNEAIKSLELKKAILSQEYAWYSLFSAFENYDADRLLIDQELLRKYYLNAGFIDFQVVSTVSELSPRKDSFIISFSLQEGKRYKFGKVAIKSNIKGLEVKELNCLFNIKEDTIFKIRSVEAAMDKITEYLGTQGYAFAEVDYDIVKEKRGDDNFANIQLTINHDSKIYINKINIFNNILTSDKVIRREFRVAEGDPYNTAKIQRSKQRIKNLGYFSLVDFQNEKTSDPDKVDINVKVKEEPTGSIKFAVGYNTQNGLLGNISLVENNFLGKGQVLELELSKAKKSTDINFGFTEPYFMGRDLSAGFDLFSNSADKAVESSHTSHSQGAGVRLGYALGEYLWHSLSYVLKHRNVEVPKKEDVSLLIREMAGGSTTSTIGQSFTYNKLDSSILPTKGYIVRFSQELAGIGGDTKYIKNQIYTSIYWPVYKQSIIFNIFGRAGNITGLRKNQVRLADNFFIGEEYIRGFGNSGIGPRDFKKGNRGELLFTDALGGKNYYAATMELTFPLGLLEEIGVRGAVFLDLASLWDFDYVCKEDADSAKCKAQYEDVKRETNKSSLRASYGFGVLWQSPIGNIRIDYGIPLEKEKFDKKEGLRISIGYGMI